MKRERFVSKSFIHKLQVLIVLLIFSLPLFSYQDSSFSLFTPTALEEGGMELSVMHRFFGPVHSEVWDTFFGMNEGANVGLVFRRNIRYMAELKVGYTRVRKQLELGVSWQPPLEGLPVVMQIDVSYLDFERLGIDTRRRNFVYIISAQNRVYSERVILSTNLGYDAYHERFVNGYALHLKFIENTTFLGEYYPVWDRGSASTALKRHIGDYDAFSFGVKYDTWGHHFKFSLGNGTQFHPATQSLGTDNRSDLHFGFNIQRRF